MSLRGPIFPEHLAASDAFVRRTRTCNVHARANSAASAERELTSLAWVRIHCQAWIFGKHSDLGQSDVNLSVAQGPC